MARCRAHADYGDAARSFWMAGSRDVNASWPCWPNGLACSALITMNGPVNKQRRNANDGTRAPCHLCAAVSGGFRATVTSCFAWERVSGFFGFGL